MAENFFGNMLKGVVDTERGLLALDAELHADLEAAMIKDGSLQKNLWGINLYPDEAGENFIEFDSMINIRPSQNNMSRGVRDPLVQQKIIDIVRKIVHDA